MFIVSFDRGFRKPRLNQTIKKHYIITLKQLHFTSSRDDEPPLTPILILMVDTSSNGVTFTVDRVSVLILINAGYSGL